MRSDGIEDNVPYTSPVQPHELTLDSEFRFDCHTGVACFNVCCRNIDIQITPYDIVRLRRRLGLSSSGFVARYTLPYEMDAHGMPGLKMNTKPGSPECAFLGEDGCTIYEDRPVACRYYALGNMAVRRKDSATVEDVFFVVKEQHCLGHAEPRTQSVAEYRRAQGADLYDEMNREWRDIVLKKRSSGPTVGAPSPRSLQLFDMCSYDMDSFREFIQSEGFGSIFALEPGELEVLVQDDDQLLRFSFRFLKQVLFGERSIALQQGAREQRIASRRAVWAERRGADIEARAEELERTRREDGKQFRAPRDDQD